MIYYDTHAHYNDEKFDDVVDETIKECLDIGVHYINNIGYNIESSKKAIELSKKYNECYAVIGIHPSDVGKCEVEDIEKLYKNLNNGKIVAIGEIGLDYYWMEDPEDVQERVFRRQIALAKEFHLPISIHTRDAMADTYRILKEEGVPERGGIMHSFSGDAAWAEKFLALGMHLSFSGVVTFKKATEVQEAAQHVPFDRLLVETDAPYLAPVPYRGKRNEPGYTRYVAEKIAELRGVSLEEVAEKTTQNAHRLFRIGAYA